jgi:Na+/H+ antiporter NhaD/arsenite permease-like protein
MDQTIGNLDIIVVAIGVASAIIDNVPLVAATMGMYDLSTFQLIVNCGYSWLIVPAQGAVFSSLVLQQV